MEPLVSGPIVAKSCEYICAFLKWVIRFPKWHLDEGIWSIVTVVEDAAPIPGTLNLVLTKAAETSTAGS
ncbi:Nn.00g037060.m01.CDS01 [Neocucurbitaria sp. VM-36]